MRQTTHLSYFTRFTAPIVLWAFTAVLAAGCDVALGGTAYTPDECGRFAGCDFANPIGVGGDLLVHISGLDGNSTIGIDLEATDPEILAISPTGDVGGQPTWQLIGLVEGPVSILAVDTQDRQAVDYINVNVVQPSKLILENIIGDAVGPIDDAPGYDEHWIVNANERAVFYVLATQEDTSPIMGQYDYTFTVDPGLDEALTDPNSLSLGRLDITPATPGQYEVVFDNSVGNAITVLIDVQATL
jgi:hypothetical protein